MKKFLLTAFSALALTFGAQAQDTYIPLTNTSQLTDGTECILVYKSGTTTIAMGPQTNTNYRDGVTLDASAINTDGSIVPSATVQIITLQALDSSWILKTADNSALQAGNSSNYLKTATSLPTAKGDKTWTISVNTDGTTNIEAGLDGNVSKYIKYNTGSPRFSCYKSGQQDVTLYVKQGVPTATMAPGFEDYTGGKCLWWDATNVKLIVEEGATAYYTIDGTEPTTASTAYDATTGIAIAAATEEGQTVTIKAVAKKGELDLSPVAELVLTAAKPYKYVATVNLLPGIPYRWVVNAGTAEAPEYKINTQTAANSFYVLTEDVVLTDDSFTTADKSNAITFTATAEEGKYLMQQGNGEYLYMDATHFSFNHTATAPATDAADYNNYLWTVEAQADGSAKIANVGRTNTVDEVTTGLFVEYSANFKNFTINNPANTAGPLPTLYAPEEMLIGDPELYFPEGTEQTVKALAFTTIDAAVAKAAGFKGNITYAVVDSEGNTPAQADYSLMIGDGMLNLMFKKAGVYTLTAKSEPVGTFLAGFAETKFIVEKIATTISFAHDNFTGVENVEITTLDKAVVTPDTYDGTVEYALSGEGLTADDYTFDLTGKFPKLTVKKEGTWTLTATAPATDAFESSTTTATVTIAKGQTPPAPEAPAAPIVKVGDTVLSTSTTFESKETVEVTLSCETEGAKIYYYIDAVAAPEPTAVEYTLYEGAFKVEATSVLRVYSELNDVKSETASYMIDIKPNTVAMTVADLENAEVYSLQGIRVANPEAGKIYIVRQGGRTYKAIVK